MDEQLSFTNPQDLTPAHYLDQQPSGLFELDGFYHFPLTASRERLHARGDQRLCARGVGELGPGDERGSHQRIRVDGRKREGDTPVAIALVQHLLHSAQNAGNSELGRNGDASNVVSRSGPGPAGSGASCNAGENPAWVQLPAFTLGQQNSGTIMGNVIRFPEGVYLNASIGKMFPIHDRVSLELRADFQNVINNVVLIGSFSSTPTATTYGSDVGPTQNNDPRYFRVRRS